MMTSGWYFKAYVQCVISYIFLSNVCLSLNRFHNWSNYACGWYYSESCSKQKACCRATSTSLLIVLSIIVANFNVYFKRSFTVANAPKETTYAYWSPIRRRCSAKIIRNNKTRSPCVVGFDAERSEQYRTNESATLDLRGRGGQKGGAVPFASTEDDRNLAANDSSAQLQLQDQTISTQVTRRHALSVRPSIYPFVCPSVRSILVISNWLSSNFINKGKQDIWNGGGRTSHQRWNVTEISRRTFVSLERGRTDREGMTWRQVDDVWKAELPRHDELRRATRIGGKLMILRLYISSIAMGLGEF